MRDRAGFAGFRVQFVTDWRDDVAAFLGASYFRAVGGDTRQYGLSARALAVDTAFPRPEEFPRFTSFWFERPAKEAGTLTLYGLLDSPSVAGAVRFLITPGGTQIMSIDTAFYPRKPIERIGIAPLTSMFFYGENDRRIANDWRPEIHDSDGLSMWTGAGEWIWRPLLNPAQLHLNSYFDDNPRGFGLLQRDRDFDHYQDDGVYYDRRPSLWVEPLGDWGEGAVQLVELPTNDETEDNIVAMWVPKEPVKAGSSLRYRYRLQWCATEPHETDLARCVATRIGRGGEPGKPRPKGVHKFMVEFLGGPLAALPFGVKPKPVLWSSSGTFSYVFTEAVPDGVPGHWRAQFDFTGSGPKVVDMRLYLKNGEETLSETWLYQFHIV
jgi:glucans biosynthesis protein